MKQFLYFFLVVFFTSCTTGSNTIYKKPENLIPRDSMVNLLVDMYIASSSKHFKNKKLERDVDYMPLVYKKYKIDSLRFKESNIYYTSKVESYDLLLKLAKEKLEKLQKKYADSLMKSDSLMKLEDDMSEIPDSLNLKKMSLDLMDELKDESE